VTGLLVNGIFLTLLQLTTSAYETSYHKGTIYALASAINAPISHLLNCLFVFGWPAQYFTSLLSMVPVQISNILVGTILTSCMETIEFQDNANKFLQKLNIDNSYDLSPIAVMVIGSMWSYMVTNMVMSIPEKKKN